MNDLTRHPDREVEFRSLYEQVYADVVRFLQRRVGGDHAEDAAADAFLIVWRRLDELPGDTGDARAWVFGIARNVALNRHRGLRRQSALGVRLADHTARAVDTSHVDGVVLEADLTRAWNRLSAVHQEALALAVFEDLDAPRAAAVLGISPVAYRLRLSRARRALRLHLDHAPSPGGSAAPVPATPEGTCAP